MYPVGCRTQSSNAPHDQEKVKKFLWSGETDRCLAKALVEQVKKGYKIDNILKPEAYIASLAILNEKFGQNLKKDHIKNRLKTWKKQFRMLNEILAHKGFQWDKEHKMVVADNSVWNDYIKAHPDARHFRAKFIENYDELCIIIGKDQSIVRTFQDHTENIADLTGDDEAGEAATVSPTDNSHIRYQRWTEEMDLCLGQILVEQTKKGYRHGRLHETYDTALTALNEKFGTDLEKDHIRNRLKTWKRHFGVLKELLSHNEFQWDKKLKVVIANDLVWRNYVKTHPDARIFQARAIENYDQWCIIFGDNNETESYQIIGDDAESCFATDVEVLNAVDATHMGGTFNDQVRNVRWTNEMDHCLSKILVQQVKLGNKSKSDNKLNSAAYIAAVSALNEKFQLDLSKAHVKNRLKTWKKQYGTLKELLNQGNFKWDDKRKMVIADDFGWYSYCKSNPDARLLQGRIIENYDELCIIMGDDDPTESCSLDDAEVDLDMTAENEGMETEHAFLSLTDNGKERGKYITWTEEMDRCLTEKLVEQVKLGNKVERIFKPVAYAAALTALNDKFSLELTKENIRNRLKTWKKLYGLVKELLSHNGFEWDERQKMVIANESVWNEVIKTHPDVRFVRARTIANYNELQTIFGNQQATGYWSRSSTDFGANPPSQINTLNNEEHAEAPADKMMVEEELSHDDGGNGTQESSQQTRARPPSSSHSKQPSRKRSASDAVVEMMSAIAANVGKIADALTESNNTVNLDELFEMVQSIPGFDDDLIIEACEFLSFDEKRAKMFLKLNERLRKKWLLKRLRSPCS